MPDFTPSSPGTQDRQISPSAHPIFWIFVAAVLAPLLAQTPPGRRVPVVVLELALGVIAGPAVLGLLETGEFLTAMKSAGMLGVMFMAGMEIDLRRIRGRPLSLAVLGWLMSASIAFLLVGLSDVIPGVQAPMMVVIALSTTGLGTLLPIMRDSGQLDQLFGRMLFAAGTVGEIAPIVAISLALSDRYSTTQEFAFLAVFLVLFALAVTLGVRARPPKIIALLSRTMHASTQLPVRLAVLVMGILIVVSSEFGFETVLGAFAAGMIVGFAARGEAGKEFRIKIDAVFFGFLAPFFFVGTGVEWDLDALTQDFTRILLTPTFLLLFLLVRGVPTILYRRDLAKAELLPFALSSSVASLALVVIICQIGSKSGHMNTDIAQALIAAAVLSLVVYPTLAGTLLSRIKPAQ